MLYSIVIVVVYFSFSHGQINDTVVRQTRPLSSLTFDEIMVDGAFDIFLSQRSNRSSTPTVEIETTVDIQNYVIVEIINNHILSIHIKGPLMIDKNIYAYVRFNSPLRRYTIKGTGNTMTDDNGISNDDRNTFVLDHRGVANVAMGLNVNKFEVYFTGTGNSRFWGKVRQEAIFDAKGVGDINALDLSPKQVKVRAMGVSIIRVAATDDVQIEATGISSVYYRLPPGKKPSKAKSTGLGKIVPIA
ncbi:unnamed protein product [Rotaria magnacalcarata]|uniref:Putative auto-transporter adhesin head GIN domain-containing protein n=1 Tax=Rotaria magnacalcarata TaxID=392030 RepID=A0A816QL27_9BILA|nr:unnamed protein product [Rotaria magnacalcarata]CAF2061278.1 unnamed protein product [Rotaria magnacalcarata]CAF4028353.1 unnamed protein product [Rotaria magnacalcarata]CAF4745245.1 unnamed protein product [Rotaria magnacalcarata]